MTTTRHLTILLTDIKGFSDKTSHKSRKDIDAMLAEHRDIVLPALEDRGGRLLKTIGDAFLMTFDSPTDAVLAGMAVQDALSKRNEGRVGDDRLEVRIAIHAGEVNITDSDIFGEPVNITARIEGIAEAGEVFFTEAVYFAMNKAEVPSSEVGRFRLKGIEGEFKVYKVRRETPLSGTHGPAQAAVRAATRVFDIPEPAPKAWRLDAPRPAAGVETREARKARLRGLLRRAAATAVDIVLVSLIAGVLFDGDDHDHRHDESVKASARPATEPQEDKAVVRAVVDGKAALVTLGESGLHIKGEGGGREVHLGPAGFTVKEKGKTRVNIALPAAMAEEVSEELSQAASDREETEDSRRSHSGSLEDKLFPFLWIGMNMLALSMWGATPGKRMLSYRVVRHQDGTAPDGKTYLMRTMMTLVSAVPIGLGYLWAWWDKDGRGWHDLVAGTRVVRVEDSAKSA